MPDAARPQPLGPAATAAALALLLLLTLLLAVWGAFFVPLRLGGFPFPVSLVVAVVGNVALGRAAGALVGRPGAGAVGLLWLVVVVVLMSQRSEGDLVLYGNLGLLFLVLGALASAFTYGAVPRERDEAVGN